MKAERRAAKKARRPPRADVGNRVPQTGDEVLEEIEKLPEPKDQYERQFLDLKLKAIGNWRHLINIMPTVTVPKDQLEKWNKTSMAEFALLVRKSRTAFGADARLTALLHLLLVHAIVEMKFKGQSNAIEQASLYARVMVGLE
jgi:hypothetical protein